MTLKWERGHTMTATAVPAYLGNPANVDPDAFVAIEKSLRSREKVAPQV